MPQAQKHTPRLDAGREVCLSCPVLLAGERYGTADWPCVICVQAQCLWQRMEHALGVADSAEHPEKAACRERIKLAIIAGDYRAVIDNLLRALEVEKASARSRSHD